MKTILSIVISILVLIIPSTLPSANVGVTSAIITTGVTSSARPETANLSVVDRSIGTITFYTVIVGFQGQTVSHHWYYRGNEISSITLRISAVRSLNWSRSSIDVNQIGRWEARIIDQNGNILAFRKFDVVESGADMGQIIQRKQIDSCAVKLQDLQDKIDENPDVDYYRFLFKKQSARCQ